ncbi:hypothetical protein G7Y89_g14048 [Cudoniella acicularis]|uniref:Uncharacterized protein n=1 Tax=Cudoniella acicularis TaxID=354080 RepID=A0A8H4R5S4_9HELO|nr:hypothetical protein G7Y89_g14048 [Cudoniella acicularis]
MSKSYQHVDASTFQIRGSSAIEILLNMRDEVPAVLEATGENEIEKDGATSVREQESVGEGESPSSAEGSKIPMLPKSGHSDEIETKEMPSNLIRQLESEKEKPIPRGGLLDAIRNKRTPLRSKDHPTSTITTNNPKPKTINKSLFAVHSTNPFTAASRRRAQANPNTPEPLTSPPMPQTCRLNSRFEASPTSSEDEAMEREIDENLDSLVRKDLCLSANRKAEREKEYEVARKAVMEEIVALKTPGLGFI